MIYSHPDPKSKMLKKNFNFFLKRPHFMVFLGKIRVWAPKGNKKGCCKHNTPDIYFWFR